MIDHVNITNVLFLDIETVSNVAKYEELNEDLQYLWKLKTRSVLRKYDEEITEEDAKMAFGDKAGIYAEFGKIVCISVGFVVRDSDRNLKVRLKSYYNHDEKVLLEEFADLVAKHYNDTGRTFLCGHNIREFDIPYVCRRMVINGLKLPNALNLAGKKPWETKHLLDTLELWKFGDYKAYTSLKLLAAVLGFPSPKDDIDGSEVGRVYWEEDDLERIAIYCEKDVLATIQLVLRYQRQPILEDEFVSSVTKFSEKIESE